MATKKTSTAKKTALKKKPLLKKAVTKKAAPKASATVKVPAKSKNLRAKSVKTAPKKKAVITKKKTAPKAAPKVIKKVKAAPKKSVTVKKPLKTTKTVPKPIKAKIVKKMTTKAGKASATSQQSNIAVVSHTPPSENKKVSSHSFSATLIGALNFEPYPVKKDEEYMNEDQLKHFRNILLAWKEQLVQEADTTVEHMKEEAVFYPDILDRAAQEEKFTLELRTRDRERKLIKKIEQALESINHNEYGYCEDCGAEIGIRRLEARPTAVKCIDCKTYEEIREKQIGG